MEDFLKEKLGHGEDNFTNDWPAFEQKLERALFFKQMRVGAMVSVVLILLSIGFFSSSSFSRFNVFQNESSTEAYRGDGRFSAFNSERKTARNIDAASKVAVNSKANEQVQAETRTEDGAEITTASTTEYTENSKTKIPNGKAQTTVAAVDIYKEESTPNINEPTPDTEDGVVILASSTEQNSVKEEPTDVVVSEESEIVAMATSKVNAGEDVSSSSPSADDSDVATPEKTRGVASHGQALIPDGLESSNFKANVKPIELMVDIRDVNNMSLKAPVIPMKLVPAKKEAYVSPLQEKKPWSYSIKVYPNFTYRKFTVAANKMPYIHRDFIDQVKVSESGGFSLNVGFEASKRIGRITYLNAGVEYISYKTEANFDFMNYRDAVINNESGKITSYDFRNEAEHIVIVDANRYHYLNFPLSIAYRPWATDHVRLNIEAGGSYMYFIKASGKSIDYQTLDIIDLSERDYRNSMASICLKVGASYHVSESFNIGIEPTVVYFSNTIYTEEYPFEVVPYSVGINFKLQMKLN
ncbi:hypothetical protein [Owenweeksia hongkongensis]|uniref:hypothetical protein n=1 Tax=Owenweeksia hongkongensis TaxID=253245 RepID=UPI003A8E91AC